jgi:hypothetical protein
MYVPVRYQFRICQHGAQSFNPWTNLSGDIDVPFKTVNHNEFDFTTFLAIRGRKAQFHEFSRFKSLVTNAGDVNGLSIPNNITV